MTMTFECVGPPPERHADRVVAGMLRDLARKRAQIELAIVAAIENSKDGNPRAQQKMAERIRRAGAESVALKPGKRGRYSIQIHGWTGWDPIRDRPIYVGDPIPEKPWIACHIVQIDSKGCSRKPELWAGVILLITHHALSRAAQRLGVRASTCLMPRGASGTRPLI
jgi:hypothetical protein